MSTFKITRRSLALEFAIKTTATVTSFNGTPFVPNHCETTVYDGKVLSFLLDRMDDGGWIEDDPAGSEGSVLSVSYGGGQIIDAARADLPKVARDALAAIEAAI